MITSTIPATAPNSSLPSTSNSAGSASTTGAKSPTDPALISQNFNTFLSLLTTQLKNQDPMSPLDTNQFTQQLVSFSQVEQAINTNTKLDSLISLQSTSEAVAALPMVGKTIQYNSSTAPLSNGQATFAYNLPSNAAAAGLLVEDANGNVVYSTTADTSAGSHSFVWNGQNASGATQPDGAYSLAVVATDGAGKAITPTITATGTVDGVSVVNNVATFDVGSVSVPMSELLTVQPSSN